MNDERGAPQAQELAFEGQGGASFRGKLLRPATVDGKAPAVVLAHGEEGLDRGALAAAERLAALGFAVLVPELHPEPGAEAADLPDRSAVAALEGAAAWLARDPQVDARSIAVFGFGRGGTHAFLMGCQSRRVAAVVLFDAPTVYGDLSGERPVEPLEMALNLSVPLLAHYGEQDELVARGDADALERTLAQFSKDFAVERHGGVGRGFALPFHPGWDGAPADAAWRSSVAFLTDSLGL